MEYIHLIDINISINLDNVTLIERIGNRTKFHFVDGHSVLVKVNYGDILAEIEQVSERGFE